jgi:hypothetical protein
MEKEKKGEDAINVEFGSCLFLLKHGAECKVRLLHTG